MDDFGYDTFHMPERVNPDYTNKHGESGQTPPYEHRTPYNPYPYNLSHPGSGNATASLIFGIIDIFFIFAPVLPVVLSVIGILLSVSAAEKSRLYGLPKPGTATAGLICSIAALVLHILLYTSFFTLAAWFISIITRIGY